MTSNCAAAFILPEQGGTVPYLEPAMAEPCSSDIQGPLMKLLQMNGRFHYESDLYRILVNKMLTASTDIYDSLTGKRLPHNSRLEEGKSLESAVSTDWHKGGRKAVTVQSFIENRHGVFIPDSLEPALLVSGEPVALRYLYVRVNMDKFHTILKEIGKMEKEILGF